MSEYQYYEFQAIDRPLAAKEQKEIKALSSRAQVTPTQATFLYHYGDFRGNAEKILTQHFDMMFYIANWGTWQLMFRFPKAIVDPKWFHPYDLPPDAITITETSKYIILDIKIREENGLSGWIEGEGWMSSLLPLRDDLMRGDVRLLYLVWLRTAPYLENEDDDPIEPPIPANLGQLSEPLQAFMELVELDANWVTAAAQASPQHQAASETPLENGLSALSEAEREEFLLKLVRREPHVDLQLISRLKELAGADRSAPPTTPGHRRLSELQAIAETLEAKRQEASQRAEPRMTKSAARKKRI